MSGTRRFVLRDRAYSEFAAEVRRRSRHAPTNDVPHWSTIDDPREWRFPAKPAGVLVYRVDLDAPWIVQPARNVDRVLASALAAAKEFDIDGCDLLAAYRSSTGRIVAVGVEPGRFAVLWMSMPFSRAWGA